MFVAKQVFLEDWKMAPELQSSLLRCWSSFGIVLAFLVPALHSQTVLVDEKVSGFIGENVILRCSFTNTNPSVRITQVTWQKATNGTKQNVAIYNPTMGVSVLPPYTDRATFKNPSLDDTTLQLSRLELEDEGVFICEFATFPTGNRESQLNLTVLVKPTNKMELVANPITAKYGMTEKIPIATCTSTNGKPPGVISWETKLNGETEFMEIRNKNGTYTIKSKFLLTPSREAHQQQLTCVVNYQMERFSETLTLNMQYEPEVTVEGFDGNWYLNRLDVKLICKSDANPAVTSYLWKVLNGSRPSNMEIQNNTLFFKGPVTYDLAGTYVCEATNPIGTRSGLVVVNVTDKPLPQRAPGSVIGILGGVIAAILIIGVAVTVFIIYRRQQKHRTETDNDLIDLPPSHKPAPPPKKKQQEMKSHLTADDIQVVHLDTAKQEEEMQKLPLQTPYYDMVPPETSPYSDKLTSGNKDYDVQYAELDTSALASSPSPRSSIHTGGGDLVEYATIQPNLR